MAVNVWGIVAIVVFYVIIFVIGVWAGRKSKGIGKNANAEDLMLAGRNIGPFLGIFTLTATWVGGGYINGTAEYVYTSGLIWCQAPIGYSISLALGGFFFAGTMRRAGYVTMLDPFHKKYGSIMTAFLYIPALLGDLFWSAAILSALGTSLTVVIGLDITISVIVSAVIAILYTLVGGLYSVAYTDVAQLAFLLFGLFLSFPFAMKHEAVSDIGTTILGENGWIAGDPPIAINDIGLYVEGWLQLIMGGIPWQVYFQRVLASKTARGAQMLSVAGGIGCLLSAVPAVMIGAVAKSTNWSMTDYYLVENKTIPIPSEDHKLILPMVLQYLTPDVVAFFGLGAVSAAVMSSTDSALLSIGSMFSHNVYRPFRKLCSRGKASEQELVWIMRLMVVIGGAIAMVLGIKITSVYTLFYLCSDLVYVILFPQLVCVLYLSWSNTYGAIAGYIIGFIMRIGGGEALIDLPYFIKYPWFDEENDAQRFPFKTLSMIVSLLTIIVVSFPISYMLEKGIIPKQYDILKCCRDIDNDEREKEEEIAMETDSSFSNLKNPKVAVTGLSYHRRSEEDLTKEDFDKSDECDGAYNPSFTGENGHI